jgi:pentatricopeptide repeat protein
MYNTVLNGCSLAKSKAHADRCLMLMDRQGVAKDELSYVELIKVSDYYIDVLVMR